MPLGILFPASIKKTRFISCKGLKDVKKALINSKNLWIARSNWPKKINNWNEIKGQSIQLNATLEEQKEINNSRNLCFPFTTKALNNLLSFSIYLLDDNNKEITFVDGEKEISILNFKIDVFLRWIEN